MKKRIINLLVIFALFIAIQIILNVLNLNKISLLVVEFLVLGLSAYLTIIILEYQIRKTEEEDLKNVRRTRVSPQNLFINLGRDIDTDKIIYDILGNQIDYPDTLTNLKNLKKSIIDKVGDDVKDYLLLKEVLEVEQKQNFLSVLKALSKPLFTAIVTAFITTVLINKIATSISNAWDVYAFLSIVMNIGYVILFLLYVISMSYSSFNSTTKRTTIFLKILEIIITEKSVENNTDSNEVNNNC